jgi:hypothetical protein
VAQEEGNKRVKKVTGTIGMREEGRWAVFEAGPCGALCRWREARGEENPGACAERGKPVSVYIELVYGRGEITHSWGNSTGWDRLPSPSEGRSAQLAALHR